MTASATSSPITLLGSVADTAKAAAPAAAGASSDAGGDGFQLLLAQAADAVRSAAGLLMPSADTAATSGGDAEQPATADGNALPPLGALLPLAPTAVAGESNADAGGSHQRSESDDENDEDTGALPVGLVVALPIAPAAAPASESVSAPVVESSTAATAVAAPITAPVAAAPVEPRALPVATTAAPASDQPPAPTPAQFAVTLPEMGDAASDTTAVTAKNDSLVPLSAVKIAKEGGGDESVASAAQSVAARANIGSEKAGGSEATGESDFDALIKQLDAANSTGSASTPSTAAGVDGSRVVHQAARAYAAPHTATATVSVPVNAEGWSDAVTDKVMWFSAQNISSAEIHLNPPDLGPLQVRISTQQDQTSVVFSSQHAAVREALDQALPRLRDMLNGQGLQLVDVGVGQGGARQHDNGQQARGDAQARTATNGFAGDGSDAAEPIAVTSIAASRFARSGIDAYA